MGNSRHQIHDTDSKMILKPILKEACQKHQVPEGVQAQLIADGIKQFSVFSDGAVIPTGLKYRTVDQFVEQHKRDKPSGVSLTKRTKDVLLEEMARHGRAGNMSAYKECRKKYSECS